MTPISLAVTLLAYSGALGWLAAWVRPGLQLLGLPGETAAPLIVAGALNIYSGIAALGSIALTSREVTILAFFMLTVHNLPVEIAVQRRAGSSAWQILLLRLSFAVAGAAILNLVMPAGEAVRVARGQAVASTPGLAAMLAAWGAGSAWLIGKVLVLVVALMILERVLAEFGIARLLAKVFAPVLLVMGLPRRTAFLWITMNTLGLAYGAAVLMEEAESGTVPKEEIELLNRSAALCHSLLEDTLLFLAIGAWALWITIPRLVCAAAAVWGYRAARRFTEPGRSSQRDTGIPAGEGP
jgi:spore maturation protein SpmB